MGGAGRGPVNAGILARGPVQSQESADREVAKDSC